MSFDSVAAPAVIITEECPYCQKWYPAGDFVRFGPDKDGGTTGEGILKRCQKCEETHKKALDVLAGSRPDECGICYKPMARLLREAGGPVQMKVIDAAGTYVVACPACETKLVEALKHLYKGTPFGAARKL